ncbi:putative F-box/LRR-repeat protein 23 [Silene latifolia]|uniref:putative F-box/LRR-repeat protein 23 n=1 Tax=Silene latifolia TaxID=37657 RepID=UPI003D772340
MAISNSPAENYRNWLELPREVTLMILMKLTPLEIYKRVQFVCKLWHNLCKEPYMWQTIHINTFDEPRWDDELLEMMNDAVDRSAGGLIDLNIVGFATDLFVSHLANRSTQLKRLRLAECYDISEEALIGLLESLSSLEELELTRCFFPHEKAVPIIKACPSLTVFKLNNVCSKSRDSACDSEAVAIVGSMPKLRHLQLIGNSLTDDGLTAVLEGCPHLQSLDLRACLHVKLVGNLGKRLLEQIKDVRRPYDSTDDYNYPVITSEISDSDDEVYRYDPDYMTDMSDDDPTSIGGQF